MFRAFKTLWVLVLACTVLLAATAAAQNDNDLPAAPSAVLKPKSAPQPPPTQPKPADPVPTESSSPKAEAQSANDQKTSNSNESADKNENSDLVGPKIIHF